MVLHCQLTLDGVSFCDGIACKSRSCMPGKDADMLYSRLDLLLPYVCHETFHSGCTDIHAVDAETNETPVRSFKVSRSHQGKLFLDGIEKALANRGLVLLGIGEEGLPAHKDGWTITTYNTSPVQLVVGPKPGMDTTYGSGVSMGNVACMFDCTAADVDAGLQPCH